MTRCAQIILIGDHHQLPPVVKNMAFQKYSHLDQPLFTRFIRLGVPHIQLDAQVRTSSAYGALLFDGSNRACELRVLVGLVRCDAGGLQIANSSQQGNSSQQAVCC